jgi:hypothetical protein
MGSEQEAKPSSIPVGTDLRSPLIRGNSRAGLARQPWEDYQNFRCCLTFDDAGVWCRAWPGEGTICLSIRVVPVALDVLILHQEDPSTHHTTIVRSMVENGWPALLAALSFIISTNLSDEVFVASNKRRRDATPRNALFNSLSKFAIPLAIVSSLGFHIEPPTPRTATSFTENFGLIAPVPASGLSEWNLACLKVLVSSALFLASSLGESWYAILEAFKGSQISTNR